MCRHPKSLPAKTRRRKIRHLSLSDQPTFRSTFMKPIQEIPAFLLFSASMIFGQQSGYVAPLWENANTDGIVPLSATTASSLTQPPAYSPSPPQNFAPLSLISASSPEITGLAEALGNDPVRIFNHVRNNIQYEQYLGQRKGPVLTLLEGSGNDLDTCVLLGELLKAAGVTSVDYMYQVRRIPLSELPAWMGLANDPWPGQTYFQVSGEQPPVGMTDLDAKRIVNHILFQRNRNTEAYGLWNGDSQSCNMSRFWLRFNYQGVDYDLDPSFKRYEAFPGVDLKTLSGYALTGKNRTALLTTAGGAEVAGSVTNVSNPNISSFLTARTQELLTNLRNQYPGWTPEEIIAGRRIIREEITDLSQGYSLPNAFGDGVGPAYYWRDTLTPNLQSHVTFSTGSLTYSCPTAELKGRKVALAAVNDEVQLWLDDTKVAHTTVTAATYQFTIEVTHPGRPTPHRETKVYKKNNEYVYAIIYGFKASERIIRQRHEKLQEYLKTDATAANRAARSEILNIMGLTWLYQTELTNSALSARNDVIDLHYHRFGRMAQEQGYYVDVGLQLSGAYVADGIQDSRYDNVFHLGSMYWSAMEHGIIEQMQPGSSAVSTVNILRKANETGTKRIYRIDNALVLSGAAWTTVKTALADYNTAATKNGVYDFGLEPFTDANSNGIWDPGETWTDKTELEQFEFFAINGGAAMLPQNRSLTQGQWTGSGWVLRNPKLAGMIISGGYSGGYSTNWGYVAPRPISNITYTNPSFGYKAPSYTTSAYVAPAVSSPRFFGSDPVDMASGAFVYSNTDLETGTEGSPRGLAFSRQYSSNLRTRNDQFLGHGWTHSLHIRANDRTATEEALGFGNARQMAPFLTAIAIASDLYRQDATVKEHAIAALVTGWYVDRLTHNAVSITIGDQVHQFLRNPDGTFEAPSGSTLTLTQTGTGATRIYRLKQRNGNEFLFEKSAGNTDGSEPRIKEITDPDGRKMTFAYLAATPDNRLNYVQDAAARRYTFRYDTQNRIDRITDSTDARFTGYAYDTSNNLISLTDPEGKISYYDHSIPAGQNPSDPSATVPADHRIVRLRNHDGQIITQNIYDSLGRVSEQYHHGNTAYTWKLRYTGSANTEENPEGGITTYFYDQRGRASGKRDPEGNLESWKYDGEDRISEKTTAAGETSVFHYDTQHNLKKIDHPRGGGSSWLFYDTLNRLHYTINPDGHQTTNIYNAGNTKNRPDQITDPAGTTTYQYITTGSAIGRIWKITDPQNLLTEYGYHATFGHPIWVKSPGGFQTFYNISSRGDLLDTTNPNSVKTAYLYNKRRQVTKVTTDQGGVDEAVEDYTYNNQALLDRQTSPLDNNGQRFATRYEYSPTEKNRFTRTTDNDGENGNDPFTEISYDGRDWQTQIMDAGGRVTSFTPLANGQPWKTTLPLARVKEQTQDADGRPIGGSVPGAPTARSSSLLYDTAPSGYPRTITTTADTLSVSEIQDRSGNPRFYTNRKNNVWEFRYDGLGRRTHVISPLDAFANRSHLTEYHHRGAVKKTTEPSGQIANFTYHATTGRLTSASDNTGTINFTSYDNNGNLLTTAETRNGVTGTKTTTRAYDRQNRLKARTDENGQKIEYRHYPSGKLRKIIYPGGTETGIGHVEYTWWPDGNLKEVIDRLNSTTTPRTTSYEWQKDGRLKKVTRPNGTVREVRYDAAGRPEVNEEYGPGMKLIFVHKHGFFPSDEMQWKYSLPAKRTSGNDPPASGGMTYNADNQLKTWNSQTIVHDADGNMTTGPAPTGDTLTTYGYDSRNRLTDTPGNTFSYDADGQRVGMTSGADTTSFVTDVSSALSKVLVRTKNGVSTRYVWGLGLLYEVSSTGNTVSYHHDATGSTQALTDGTGKVIERIGYTPWGQINHRINLSGTPHDTPFLFTGFFGNQTDAGGLLYMRNRYYHPRIGRFLNADPAQEGMNWYAYAGGNPIGMVDPMGLGITSALNGIQTTLSFLGMAPVFGVVFDVVNAGISIGRGNYVDAGFNLASAIPGIGDFAAGAKLIGGGAAAYGGYRAYNAISHGVSASRAPAMAANRVGYHATHADVVPLIQQNGFRAGTAPGRLGSGGTYVNSTPQGAIAEFAHHNPGVTPSVLKVQYNPGINASTSVAPRNYVERLPFHNVDSISAPSVRLPGTTNTNVLNGSLRIIE
jgi:RHS repeat-associated protein